MANNSTTTSSGGVGFTGLLTILFIALKLTHTITWSWWWVLSPIWISASLVAIVIAVVLFAITAETAKSRRKARR